MGIHPTAPSEGSQCPSEGEALSPGHVTLPRIISPSCVDCLEDAEIQVLLNVYSHIETIPWAADSIRKLDIKLQEALSRIHPEGSPHPEPQQTCTVPTGAQVKAEIGLLDPAKRTPLYLCPQVPMILQNLNTLQDFPANSPHASPAPSSFAVASPPFRTLYAPQVNQRSTAPGISEYHAGQGRSSVSGSQVHHVRRMSADSVHSGAPSSAYRKQIGQVPAAQVEQLPPQTPAQELH
jgi:hypothetical protein